MNKIRSYLQDFGMSQDDITAYIQCLARKRSMEEDEVVSYLAETMDKIVENSILMFEQNTGLSLRQYQKCAVRHMLTDRGMIAAFDVGTGKTITAVCTIYVLRTLSQMLNLGLSFIFVTPASLVDNMKTALKKYGLPIRDKNFYFYSVTKYSKKIVKHFDPSIDFSLPNPKRTVLVIDEAHNLKKSNLIYIPGVIRPNADIRRPSQGDNAHAYGHLCAKVLALSATPVYNAEHDPFLIAMQVAGRPVGDNYPGDQAAVINPLRNRIMFVKADEENFPARQDFYHLISMSPEYLEAYYDLEERTYNNTDPDAEDVVNAFMGKLRQAANKLPDQDCMKCDVATSLVTRAPPVQLLDGTTSGAKIIIYSTFLDSGIVPIIAALEQQGITPYIISGKTKMRLRQQYTDEFNNSLEKSVAVITKAGSEGLDFKGVTDVILIEPVWNVSSETQTTGRGIRFRSHKHYREKYQKVRIHHLLLAKPFANPDLIKNLRYPEHYNFTKAVSHGEMREETPEEKKRAENTYRHLNKKMKDTLAYYSADLYMIRLMMEKQENLDQLNAVLQQNEIPC